jgi:serine O-acetyltransferase
MEDPSADESKDRFGGGTRAFPTTSPAAEHPPPPSDEAVSQWLDQLRALLFAEVLDPMRASSPAAIGSAQESLRIGLATLLRRVGEIEVWAGGDVASPLGFDPDREAVAFLEGLPAIAELLRLDVEAALAGDPAAESAAEVVLCYPGLRALVAHRAAHALHRRGRRLLARLLAESAHRVTGIDLHPAASIGRSCFIDHGTGVVVGATAVIGERCRIYQGVTLGARSFPRDERGRLLRGGQRHPTLEDDVVVYANATILGGDTVIGAGSEIGGGVYLTESVPPGHLVVAARPELRIRPRRPERG